MWICPLAYGNAAVTRILRVMLGFGSRWMLLAKRGIVSKLGRGRQSPSRPFGT